MTNLEFWALLALVASFVIGIVTADVSDYY